MLRAEIPPGEVAIRVPTEKSPARLRVGEMSKSDEDSAVGERAVEAGDDGKAGRAQGFDDAGDDAAQVISAEAL